MSLLELKMHEPTQSALPPVCDRSARYLQIAYQYGTPSCTAIITHPLNYARILMMLGHEPDPPMLRPVPYSLLKPKYRRLVYPSVFTYLNNLREKLGLFGVFTTGLPASILGGFIKLYVTERTTDRLMNYPQKHSHYVTDEGLDVFLKETSKLCAARVLGVSLSYPFQVIMIRQMAQSVGDEIVYRNLFSAINQIIKDEGISSLFSGLMPRIIEEVITVWLIGYLVYLMDSCIFKKDDDPPLRKHTPVIATMMVSNTTHPLTVTSTVMSLSGSRLSLGLPFDNWWRCYSFLSKRDCLKRGSSLFFRYAPAL